MEIHKIQVREEMNNERIDKLLSGQFEAFSRSQIQLLMKEGNLLVNGATTKANYKVKTGDAIEIHVPELEVLEVLPQDLPLDIYYEDHDVIVVNKPRGMVVHPAPGHVKDTLVNALMFHCKDLSGINGVMRPGIVHRIDKDTTGLLMVAKNDMAHERLVVQLQEKTVTRRYQAIVHGVIAHDDATIDAPIGRDKKDRQSMTVTEENSRNAITHFHVLERFNAYSLIECKLETGRTHQIRVHMKYIGFPIVGDPKYGPRHTPSIGGQALHAGVLGFVHPKTGEYLEFTAPVPVYFTELVNQLQSGHDLT